MFHDHYDAMGNSRTSTGQINSPYSHMGSTAEQWAAGVGEYDSSLGASLKVEAYRRANGLDIYTGAPLSTHHGAYLGPDTPRGTSAGALKFLKRAFLLVLLASALLAAPALWRESAEQRFALADVIEGFVVEKAIEGEKTAPFSAYAQYVPKKRAPSSTAPAEINAKAKKLFASRKPPSDKTIAYWGSNAWECLSENPLCLEQAGVRGKGARDIRLLGLLFLDMARRKGSPDAGADAGLFLMSEKSQRGKDPASALSLWRAHAKENPKAVRAQRLLDQVQSSPWASYAERASRLLRFGLWPRATTKTRERS